MSIYSAKLVVASFTSIGSTDVYTVPVAEGPTILKGVTIQCPIGGVGELYLHDGVADMDIVEFDNTTGAAKLAVFFPLWHVLEPGDTLAFNRTSASYTGVIVSGQHFLQP